jgi:hypothetical protein
MTGKQKGQLMELIDQTFDPATFVMFLDLRLDKKLARMVGPNDDFPSQIFKVINRAENEVWESDLLDALVAERPKKVQLVNFVADFRLNNGMLYQNGPEEMLNKPGLEALINNIPNIPPAVFIAGLMNSKKCVCRIQAVDKNGAPFFGTGFLIGPDLILTNYHVVEHVINNPEYIPSVICKFDYEVQADGTVKTGMDVSLATNPFKAYSPYGPLDIQGSPNIDVPWPADKLDYALLKLEREVGNEPFGIKAENAIANNENKRGWINSLNDPLTYLNPGGHMIIIQHPNKEPVKIGFGFNAVKGYDEKGLRVRYAINTMGGSSGSPCFNKDFGWVALHNMGDPEWIPTYNQGIPADKIIQDLNSKGITLTKF